MSRAPESGSEPHLREILQALRNGLLPCQCHFGPPGHAACLDSSGSLGRSKEPQAPRGKQSNLQSFRTTLPAGCVTGSGRLVGRLSLKSLSDETKPLLRSDFGHISPLLTGSEKNNPRKDTRGVCGPPSAAEQGFDLTTLMIPPYSS